MGLDMHLYRHTYVQNWEYDSANRWEIKITKNGKSSSINSEKIAYVIEQVGYWRKANAIHMWFVNNIQSRKDDCGEYYVSFEKLQELRDTCQAVIDNPDLAEEKLPTASGFFFGGTGYGDCYFEDIAETIKILDEALKADNEDHSTYYYRSSW